jgi:transcriptional regulator with XRE-family HTH domain
MAAATAVTERRTNARGRGGRSVPTVKLRRNRRGEVILFADLRASGLNNTTIAQRLGCAQSTISRLDNDEVEPSLAFIACVAETCPDAPLSRYFTSPYFSFAPKAAV